MTTGTIEETYEYRITNIIRGVLKNAKLKPTTANQLFDFLETRGAEEFANAIVADMVQWNAEENWLKKVTA